jgi:hypothetical protein
VTGYQLTAVGPVGGLLTLPLDEPLATWQDPRIVHVPRGISRHVVRFVDVDGEVYAVKEANDRWVLREHALLRALADRAVPVVEAFGTVVERSDDAGEPMPGLLLTRHLPFSQPYRALFAGRELPQLRSRLLDALVGLLVRLHLAGFAWGDCSLSNTLFRRDAGALAAYLVDAETGELHRGLSDGQRDHDVTIATENIAGELLDLQAAGRLAAEIDPVETALELGPRYAALWTELNRDEVVARDESYRIDGRIRRLNSLGFDVAEVAISAEDGGRRLRFDTRVVEPGHHQRRVRELTGLQVQENEARSLLADLARFRAKWAEGVGHEVAEDVAARAWLLEKFTATLNLVPPELRHKLPDAELYHEICEHRWFLSEAQGTDVGRATAVASYVDTVLRFLPDARVDLSDGPPTEELSPIAD